MMLLFFKDGLSRKQWSDVFHGAFRLSGIQKKKDHILRTRATVPAEELESTLQGYDDQVNEVLAGPLLESVGYFLIWNSDRFDCKLSRGLDALQMKCSGDESPEISLPHAPTLSQWITRPANPLAQLFTPYLSVSGTHVGDYGHFAFELQLRAEPVDPLAPGQLLLKGDAILDKGSVILDAPQGAPVPIYPYGYGEAVLKL